MDNNFNKRPRRGGKVSTYSDEFRKTVAEEFLAGKTYPELTQKYSIPKGTLNSFIRWYKQNCDISSFSIELKNQKLSDPNYADLLSQNSHLERLLTNAKIKIEVLDTLINIAEEQFQIDIRKKSGAKPSK